MKNQSWWWKRISRVTDGSALSAVLLVVVMGVAVISMPGCEPSNHTLRIRGGKAFEQGDHARALENYRKVLETEPEDPAANFGVGRTYLAMNQTQRARTHLTVAYHAYGLNADKNFEVAGVLAEAMAQDEDFDTLFTFLRDRAHLIGEPRDYMLWGDFAMRFDDPDTAETAYLGAARVGDEPIVDPYLRLASLYEEIGDTAQAVRRLRQAYGIDPEDKEVITRLSQYESVLGPTLALEPEDR